MGGAAGRGAVVAARIFFYPRSFICLARLNDSQKKDIKTGSYRIAQGSLKGFCVERLNENGLRPPFHIFGSGLGVCLQMVSPPDRIGLLATHCLPFHAPPAPASRVNNRTLYLTPCLNIRFTAGFIITVHHPLLHQPHTMHISPRIGATRPQHLTLLIKPCRPACWLLNAVNGHPARPGAHRGQEPQKTHCLLSNGHPAGHPRAQRPPTGAMATSTGPLPAPIVTGMARSGGSTLKSTLRSAPMPTPLTYTGLSAQ